MNFVSFSFVALFAVALLLRLTAKRRSGFFLLALLALSWTFYAWHVPSYLVLISVSTLVDYCAARGIEAVPPDRNRARRLLLLASIGVNVGLLGFFKYAGFLAETTRHLVGGSDDAFSIPDIVLPIGISFYTFQSMSYTIDVYRGKLKAEKSFLRVATYVAFFPQLVAGPIVRATDFLYQFDRRRSIRARVWSQGAYLVIRGLFLKVILADHLGWVVDKHWDRAAGEEAVPGLSLALLVFFAGQLFCDFAGYSSIARGLAYFLGFRLPVNFDAPYLARSFTEFWRRWHITLSSWMKDYLYIPLGGNRRGRLRAYGNLFLVMLISGLWHGAAWTFVAWGALHGLAVALERMIGMNRAERPLWLAAPWAIVVQLTWIFSMGWFRAEGFEAGNRMIVRALADLADLGRTGLYQAFQLTDMSLGWFLIAFVAVFHLRAWLAPHVGKLTAWEKVMAAGAMLAAVLSFNITGQQFIYFQF
ncbi:MAG: MBOAT family protein [Thermoanaerobaculia bacterium]|nr:MBOAT family protein [Thermoanaerobaculia bacterium]